MFLGSSLSSYGIALAEREISRFQSSLDERPNGFDIANKDGNISLLRSTISLMKYLESNPILEKYVRPIICHTDLHFGNVFVSDDSNVTPPKILSFIDWQSISISPLFLQARWPVFLEPPDDYPQGLVKPQRPQNYAELSEDDKKLADFTFDQVNQAKGYEISSRLNNETAYRAMTLPRVFKELFLRTGEAYEEGTIALRECLIEIWSNWAELGFSGNCPYSFSDEEVEQHRKQFEEYQEWHQVWKLARDALCTDSDGWVSPELDFEEIVTRNRELFEIYVEKYSGLKSREQCLRIWPFSAAL